MSPMSVRRAAKMQYMWLHNATCTVLLILSVIQPTVSVDPPCGLPLPKTYVVYKLLEREGGIDVDGRLDEKAWEDAPWTDRFVDIQGEDYPTPRYETYAKLRWDDTYLYVAGYLQEPDVFANQTKHDSVVFQDNDFEVFTDPDGNTHHYKEFEINAINTTWDLELSKPYLNGGNANSSWEMPTMKSGTFVEGPVNNPLVPNKYWTVELALPFKGMIHDCTVAMAPPKHGDQWRINFSRVEWHVKNVNGHYEKVPGLPEDNWVWSPQHSINMHLPERWGIIQFSTDPVNTTKFQPSPNWPVYSNLVELYNAEKKFFAINGYFTSNLTQLELPDYVRKGKCASVPHVNVIKLYNFNATVKPFNSSLPKGNIQDDRLIWYS
ncbi:Hypp5872 [Branchiostoma lanceolatum]|uniref:Hypp5872 protein n=1 Tax=Branchiostoma lanceolatum TaxID=7740 RepID=A0A8J9YRY4_BRALA|nr:Hypp5872 [Branchiostoma lanceolatum]